MVGAVALACFGIHAGWHIRRGEWWDVFWACHVGCLLVAVGALASSRGVARAGLLLDVFGFPLWILDLATGGELIPTSILTHVGGIVAGALVVRWSKPSGRGAWKLATGVLVALCALSRFLLPAQANVNLAHRVFDGWERWFPSHLSYLVLLVTVATASFFVSDWALVRLEPRPS